MELCQSWRLLHVIVDVRISLPVPAAQQIHSAFICWASRSYVYSEVIEAIPASGTRSILAKLTVNRGAA